MAEKVNVLLSEEEVDAKIIDVDNDRKRISLSIRALLEAEAPAAEPVDEEVTVYESDAAEAAPAEEAAE